MKLLLPVVSDTIVFCFLVMPLTTRKCHGMKLRVEVTATENISKVLPIIFLHSFCIVTLLILSMLSEGSIDIGDNICKGSY